VLLLAVVVVVVLLLLLVGRLGGLGGCWRATSWNTGRM
jgi:hypothetical protein